MGPHKLYIDSRARQNAGQSSHSDFAVQLPRPIEVPESRAFIDSVHIPNTFPTIHSANKWIYIVEKVGMAQFYRKLYLTEGTYNGIELAAHLQAVLNTQVIPAQASTGTNLAANSYTVVFSASTGKLTINNSSLSPGVTSYEIWPRDKLSADAGQFAMMTAPYQYVANDDCYDVLGFTGGAPLVGDSVTPALTGQAHINVMGYHTLFIQCSELGLQGDSLTCVGDTSVVRRIVLDQHQGSMVHDFHSLPFDYVRVPKSQIHQLRFRLTDWLGRTVDFENAWSFSLIFVPEDEI